MYGLLFTKNRTSSIQARASQALKLLTPDVIFSKTGDLKLESLLIRVSTCSRRVAKNKIFSHLSVCYVMNDGRVIQRVEFKIR